MMDQIIRGDIPFFDPKEEVFASANGFIRG
jgi:hypothetical protein